MVWQKEFPQEEGAYWFHGVLPHETSKSLTVMFVHKTVNEPPQYFDAWVNHTLFKGVIQGMWQTIRFPALPQEPTLDIKGEVTEFNITTNAKVTAQRVQDLLTCAIDSAYGGSFYWISGYRKVYPEGQTKESLGLQYPQIELPFKGGSIVFGNDDPKYAGKVLDAAAMLRGLQLLADNYPKHWADFIEDNEDADTADVFLQLALFGEVVFG